LDRKLVVDAERSLEVNDALGVAAGVGRAVAVQVPNGGVEDVEHDGRGDLQPPVEDCPVAQDPGPTETAVEGAK
jgi:hypothetical protein